MEPMEPVWIGGAVSGVTTKGMVHLAVKMNMQHKADEQMLSAAGNGVGLEIKSRIYAIDGAKNWPTALAAALCKQPTLAVGTRQDMADLIMSELGLAGPFNAVRLSRPLSTKAKKLADSILSRHGYNAALANTGLGIRDAVRAGAEPASSVEVAIKTTFHADGMTLGDKFYPYERVATYETEMPWHYLGVRFAGDAIQLKTVIAMRGISIGEFQALDEAAAQAADSRQANARAALDLKVIAGKYSGGIPRGVALS